MAYFLHFSRGIRDECRDYFLEQLRKEGLEAEIEDHDEKVATVRASPQSLAKEAEILKLERPLAGSHEEVLGVRIPQLAPFKVVQARQFAGGDDLESFFSTADKCMLTWSILQRIDTSKDKLEQLGHKVTNEEEPFIGACEHAKPPVIKFIKPLHESKEKRKAIEKAIVWGSFVPNRTELNQIRDYFGEEVALYFVWIAFMTKMMLIPAGFSLIWYFLRLGSDVDIVRDPFMPIFSAFMALWSILYLVLWRCHCSEFAFWWHTYDHQRSDEMNPKFKGELRVNPITDKMEEHFPFERRIFRYLASFFVMVVMVSLAILTMIVSLNLNGYVTTKESPIYIEFLASFAAPGGPFAIDNPYYGWIIPAFGHTIFIGLLNAQYRKVAAICTDFENHKTMNAWRNSLIGKRVIFEALNCFIAPLYITFYQMDVAALRTQMMRLFACDEIRRVATETGLPFLTGQVKQLDVESAEGKGIKVKKSKKLEDETMEDYEQFADYLEMVIQFGYVTLFAAALPWASIVSILFLMIETRSDVWSLLNVHRRPKVRRASDIGVWYYVMFAMVTLSMLTNSFIAFVSSSQMDYWLPRSRDNFSFDLVMAFSVEHVLVFLALLAHAYLPSQFAWVKAAIGRRIYQKRMAIVSSIRSPSVIEVLGIPH